MPDGQFSQFTHELSSIILAICDSPWPTRLFIASALYLCGWIIYDASKIPLGKDQGDEQGDKNK